MLISHEHRFIFLKTRKTAGTSIEISLSRFCGQNDIVTPITASDEAIRRSRNVRARNYRASIREYKLRDWRDLFLERRLKKKFWNHARARYVKRIIGDRIWNDYFKFCFERNPWDKVVSGFWWKNSLLPENKRPSFQEFIQARNFSFYNYPQYSDKGSVLVDYIGRYENLMEDLNTITKKIGLGFDGWLPRAKGNIRKDSKPYREYYEDRQVEIISEYFRKEIELMGYTF